MTFLGIINIHKMLRHQKFGGKTVTQCVSDSVVSVPLRVRLSVCVDLCLCLASDLAIQEMFLP